MIFKLYIHANHYEFIKCYDIIVAYKGELYGKQFWYFF